MPKAKKLFGDYTEEEIDVYRNSFVKNTLRRASYRWPYRNLAIQAAKRGRNQYECSNCKAIVANKEKQVDHIDPIVPVGESYNSEKTNAKKFFPSLSGWQVLCKEKCHAEKTAAERERRTAERRARKEIRQRKT